MPHITEDRILESTTSTGVGAIALAGAVTAFRRFNAVCAVGDTVPYFIEALDALGAPTGDYEYGIGTYSAANTLTRTQVLGSSNAGAAVNFVAGMKNVGVSMLASGVIPPGTAIMVTGSTVPSGYVKANGALLSRAQYPALWAWAQASGNITANDAAWAVGRQGSYSPGDGATTFRVPDLRGEFVRGWDDARGIDAARAIGSAQADAIKSHTHAIVGSSAAGGGSKIADTSAGGFLQDNSTGLNIGAAAETRPRNVALMYCVKT